MSSPTLPRVTSKTALSVTVQMNLHGKNPTTLDEQRNSGRQTQPRKRDKQPIKNVAGWRSLLQTIDSQLIRNPHLTRCGLLAALASISDLIAQFLEGSLFLAIDLARVLRFAAFRSAIAAPILQLWHTRLDWFVASLPVDGAAAKIAIKTALDQAFYTPFYQTLFYLSLALAEGQPLHEGRRRVLQMLPRTLPASWLFWLPIMAFVFAVVPLRWR